MQSAEYSDTSESVISETMNEVMLPKCSRGDFKAATQLENELKQQLKCIKKPKTQKRH